MSVLRVFGQQTYRRLRFGLTSWLDRRWHDNPLAKGPTGTPEEFIKIRDTAAARIYPEVERMERESGFAIDQAWHDDMMLHTIIIKKVRTPHPFHGRLIYCLVRRYIAEHNPSFMSIVETGTARGFSTLCMAKALEDSGADGHIVTIDRLPHLTPMYWRTIDDCEGPKTRRELLEPWADLCNRITFIEGDTLDQLGKIGLRRINFSFLDAQHTKPDVLHEFRKIAPLQSSGDMMFFDDVTPGMFPGVVAAVETIRANKHYAVQDFSEVGYADSRHGMAWAVRR